MDNNVTKEDQATNAEVSFSPQEVAIGAELSRNPSYKEIARKTSLSPKMVAYYMSTMMKKTGTSSKKELSAFFRRNGASFAQQEASEGEFSHENNYNKPFLILFLILLFILGAYFFKKYSVQSPHVTNVVSIKNNRLNRDKVVGSVVSVLGKQDEVRTVVIVGAGGAGKTTLARQILSSMNSRIRFEVNAETEDCLYNSFLDLAEYIANTNETKQELDVIKNLQNSDDKKKALIRFVSGILRKSEDWALMFDNVVSLRQVWSYLPLNSESFGRGTVIITTRNENIKGTSFIEDSQVVDIGVLSKKEKRELFCSILFKQDFTQLDEKLQDEVDNFLKNIPELPLDVCAVAYYLKNTKTSMAEYEKMMNSSSRELNAAQKMFLMENANYSKTRYEIVSSVFKEILKDDEQFKKLLLFICLFDSQNIPKWILKKSVNDPVYADRFINKLKQNSLIIDNGRSISIHRSTQSVGLDYIVDVLDIHEKEELIKQLVDHLCSAAYMQNIDIMKIIPHAEALSEKLSRDNLKNLENIHENQIRLLILIGKIHKYKSHKMLESLKYFEKAFTLNDQYNSLDEVSLARLQLDAGEACSLMGMNIEAESHLSQSVKYLEGKELSKNYRLLGVTKMRSKQFKEANEFFKKALEALKKAQGDQIDLKIDESNIYSDMAFNYFMDGINRTNAKKAVPIMEKAVEILAEYASDHRVVGRLAIHKIKLAAIYNALGKYDLALKLADETEKFINDSKLDNSDIYYVRGIIARERGLSNVRLNNIEEAYKYFLEANGIFSKSMTSDYLFKIKMHEAECLVRLNRLDEAFAACEDMFSTKERERNNYSDLFFNTCYYHAAIIKYRQNDFESAKKYFKKFFESMRIFCREIAPEEDCRDLEQEGAFSTNASMEDFFRNSLKVFELIYWKDYEFTKYYIEENLKLLK